jgi:hypothetical protein
MFRLINAILAYPPTMATDLRIANALGDVGPLSIATAAQNLIIYRIAWCQSLLCLRNHCYVLRYVLSPHILRGCSQCRHPPSGTSGPERSV